MELKIGMRVEHKQLGHGIIKEINGEKLRLALEKYNHYEIDASIDDLRMNKLEQKEKFLKFKSIEALRFGLVPQHDIEHLTIGYNHLKKWVDLHLDQLEGSHPTLSVIKGPFGTGKSHSLEVIRHIAIQRGFLVARVEVDGQYISLSEPAKLFREIARTLTGRDYDTDVPLFKLFADTIRNGHPKPHLFDKEDWIVANYDFIQKILLYNLEDEFGSNIEKVLSGSDDISGKEILTQLYERQWVSRKDIELKSVFTRSISQRPIEFLKALIGYAHLARLIGKKGFVITIDEVEVDSSNLSAQGNNNMVNLLSTLLRYFEKRDSNLVDAPFALFFATVDDGSNINRIINRLVELSGGKSYLLTHLTNDELVELGRKMTKLYQVAYSISTEIDTEVLNETIIHFSDRIQQNSGVIREFIKRFIWELDRLYGPPRRVG